MGVTSDGGIQYVNGSKDQVLTWDGDWYSRIPPPRGIKIYRKPGTYSWTAPQGVFSVEVAIYSAGGGGGTSSDTIARSAGGGGGGAFAVYCVGCTPGSTYSLTVGSGGSPGSASTLSIATGAFASKANLNQPHGAIVDSNKNLYVADTGNNTVKKITPSGSVSTVSFAGSQLSNPRGVAVDKDGEVYVVDTNNHVVRKTSGIIAGTFGVSGNNDGSGTAAKFFKPAGIAVDKNKNVYVSDTGNHTIRKITPSGTVTTLAGKAGESGAIDDYGSVLGESRFNSPQGLGIDADGNIFVADSNNHAIRQVFVDGYVLTYTGKMGTSGNVDSTATETRYNSPYGVTVDNDNSVYVADRNNNTIRKTMSEIIDNVPTLKTKTVASASQPTGIAVVGNEIVYTVTAGDSKILKTEAAGGTGADGGNSVCNIGRSVVIKGGSGGGAISVGAGGTVPAMSESPFNNTSGSYFTGLDGAGPGEMNNNSYGGGPATSIGDGQLALAGGRGWLIWINTSAGGGGSGKSPYSGGGSQGGHGAIILQW
jgi:sugar lactone lactonase YvrE